MNLLLIGHIDNTASLDPSAFTQASTIPDFPEYINDDVPSNQDYLSDAASIKSSLKTAQRSGTTSQLISDIDGETIRMLDPKGLNIIDEYLALPRVDPLDDLAK